MSACLLILIGLPGSGKTSLARRLCDELRGTYDVIHVEYDAAVSLEEQAQLQAVRTAGGEDDSWRAARRALEAAVEAVLSGGEVPEPLRHVVRKPADRDGADERLKDEQRGEKADQPTARQTVVIIDDNMYLRSMRYRYFQLARRRRLGFAQLLLAVPESECLVRNAARRRPVPAAAVRAMSARLEPPDPARLWEARSAAVRPDQDPVPAAAALVAAALRAPAAPLVDNTLEAAESRRVSSTSQLHQLDRQLRLLVKRAAAGCGRRAREANAARQALLRRVRAGEVGMTVEPADEGFAAAAEALFEAELGAGLEGSSTGDSQS